MFSSGISGTHSYVSSEANLKEMDEKQSQSFSYFYFHLGSEIVDSIPTVILPLNDTYPMPWINPSQMPCDLIKGLFPLTQKPFLAIRYYDLKINKFVVELFYEKQDLKIWTSQSVPYNSGICKGEMTTHEFDIIKNMFYGKSLELTEDRFLQHYQEKFVKV